MFKKWLNAILMKFGLNKINAVMDYVVAVIE